MDEYKSESLASPTLEVRSLLKNKHVRVVLILVAVVLFAVWILSTLFGSMVGVGGVASNADFYGAYAPMDSASYKGASIPSSRVAMEYDESYYPQPTTPPGGTGSYEEAEYETRAYSATVKTSNYDAVLTTIESWKPKPYIMFELANRGESSSYYRLKVEAEYAEEVLKALNALSPADLNQQTEVIKKQLLDYTSRLDVLTRQEELLTDMLQNVNDAYDELVMLSKDARDVKVLASVIDDKLKYINQLTQQRLAVANQIESIAQQKAELADRIAYVYFTITVSKYEFINTDQLKDSWVAKTQQFVRQANLLVQTMTLGLVGFLLWLFQAFLYILIVGSLALVVGKHGYRAIVKYWKS